MILGSSSSDRQIIDNYLENGNDLPILTYQLSFQSESVFVDDINPIADQYNSKIANLEEINASKTALTYFHLDTITINGNIANYSTIFYVDDNLWSTITSNTTTEAVIANIPQQIDTSSDIIINSSLEERSITTGDSMVELIQSIPDFFHQTQGGMTTNVDVFSLSVFTGPIVFLHMDDNLPVLHDLDELEQNRWEILLQLYLKHSYLDEASDLTKIRDYWIGLYRKFESIVQNHLTTTRVYSEVSAHLKTEKSRSYRDLQDNIAILIPSIIAIQIAFLYFLKMIMGRFGNKFELLHSRGYSPSNLGNKLILFYSILPTMVIGLLLIGVNYLGILDSNQFMAVIQLLLPWIFLQLFTTIYLILATIREFEQSLQKTDTNTSGRKILWYHVFGTGVIILSLLTVVNYILYRNKFWTRINDIDDTPRFIISAGWTGILILLFLTTYLLEKGVHTWGSQNLSTKFSLTQLVANPGIYVLIILTLVLSMGFATAGILQIEENSQYVDAEDNWDYTVIYLSRSSTNPVTYNHESIQEIEGLDSYLIQYQLEIGLSGDNYEFSRNLYAYNQSLYDSFPCTCTKDTSLFGDDIWVNQELYDFLFGQSESTTLSYFGDYSFDEDAISSASLSQENFSIIPHDTPLFERRKGNPIILTSLETIDRLNFTMKSTVETEIWLQMEDTTNMEAKEVKSRVEEHIDFNGNEIAVRDNSLPDSYDLSDQNDEIHVLTLINNYVTFIVLALVFVGIIILNPSLLRQLEQLRERYGVMELIRNQQYLIGLLAISIPVISFLASLIFSLFVFNGGNMMLINSEIMVKYNIEISDIIFRHIGAMLSFMVIVMIGGLLSIRSLKN